MRETVWHIAIILFVTGTVFFTNLGTARLWDRDEPRNAGCAAEMMERGDWVVPIFNDELRHQKPVLLYWFIMSAYSLLGVSEFSARFWSALLAVGTTFATYAIARRILNSTIALYAALALATSLMFDVAARAATPDSILTFFATSALMAYVLGTFVKTETGLALKSDGSWFPRNWFIVLAMYGLMGLAVLAKGPVGFLLPMAMIGLFILIQTLPAIDPEPKRRSLVNKLTRCASVFHPIHFGKTLWSMRPVLAAVVIFSIAAPWYFLVDARTEGDFTRLFFVGEHFGRATAAMENHSGGFWFYPFAILVGFFPWSVFWGPILIGLIKRPSRDAGQNSGLSADNVAVSLMLCWVGVQVGAFSLAQTKLPSYVTPCYPALAILTSACLVDFVRDRSSVNRHWFAAAFAGLVIAGIAITAGIGIAANKFLPDQVWLTGLGLIPLGFGGALIWMLYQQHMKAIPVMLVSMAVLFSTGLFGFGTVSLDSEQQSHRLFEDLNPESEIATYGCLESSWVFYANRPIHELRVDVVGDQGSNKRDLVRENWRPKPRVSLETFIDANQNGVLITTADQLESIKKRLPEDFKILQTADYFLKNKTLVLLGRFPTNRTASRAIDRNDPNASIAR